MTLAHALAANGETARARQELVQLSRDDQEDAEPYIALATIDLESGDLTAAAEHAARAVAAEPDSPEAVEIAGQVAVARGDTAAAVKHLTHAISLAPDSLDAHLTLAHVYAESGDTERARALVAGFAAKHPDLAAPRTALGIIQEAAGRRDEAKKAFEAALALDPRAAVAAGRLARIYLDTGAPLDSTIDLARTAVSSEPDQADNHATLGRAYFKAARLRSAVAELERAALLDGSDAGVKKDLEEARRALTAEQESQDKARAAETQRPL
jgi:predicted Zn-dependent protease